MKKMMLMFSGLLLAVAVFAQTDTKADSKVKFKEYTYDFGKIKQGVPVTHDFEFTNVSSSPVIIESATATCGCTTPIKPEQPVMKGKSNKITAGFNAEAVGTFNKSIYIKVAGVQAPVELKITGEVLSAGDFAKYEKSRPTKAGAGQ